MSIFQIGNECPRDRAPENRGRPTPRHRTTRIRALLPGSGRVSIRENHRRRSADSLAPSGSGIAPSRRIHSDRRSVSRDCPYRPLGAARSLSANAVLAGHGYGAGRRRSQYFGGRVRGKRFRRERSFSLARYSPGAAPPRTRVDRIRADEGCRIYSDHASRT